MGKAMFYHLTHSPMEVTATTLLSRAYAQGMRVAVRARSDTVLERLDLHLWTAGKDSFLPHGRAGGPHDADQPILLTTEDAAPNAPVCVMSIDRAEVRAEDVAGLERLWVLFDGQDAQAMDLARAQWKAMVTAGVLAEYWSEDSGTWVKKAQSGQN
ncbi:MAG: DNA polymerase III subunit chi [Rhodobacteraceae bacterium]|nr:MAG: DNA polymerase III subunit chi [Paracoccaceae bacterium]